MIIKQSHCSILSTINNYFVKFYKVSLPRSYTLPREFKYYRRNKGRKLIKNEHFITSTNSSDGK